MKHFKIMKNHFFFPFELTSLVGVNALLCIIFFSSLCEAYIPMLDFLSLIVVGAFS